MPGQHEVDGAINPDFSQVEPTWPRSRQPALRAPLPRETPVLPRRRRLRHPYGALYPNDHVAEVGLSNHWEDRASAYTLLLAKDDAADSSCSRSRVVGFAPQDFASTVGIARWRYRGCSYVGALVTVREIDGGGHNRVFGPDFLYRPRGRDHSVPGALRRHADSGAPDLASEWDGRKLAGHAVQHVGSRVEYIGLARSVRGSSDEFRADEGSPAGGVRHTLARRVQLLSHDRTLHYLRPFALADFSWDRGGAPSTSVSGRPCSFRASEPSAEIDVNLDKVGPRRPPRSHAGRVRRADRSVPPVLEDRIQGFLGEQ